MSSTYRLLDDRLRKVRAMVKTGTLPCARPGFVLVVAEAKNVEKEQAGTVLAWPVEDEAAL